METRYVQAQQQDALARRAQREVGSGITAFLIRVRIAEDGAHAVRVLIGIVIVAVAIITWLNWPQPRGGQDLPLGAPRTTLLSPSSP
jgi:hypothetical protein